MSEATVGTVKSERERILAAAGWQHDVRRRRILRELLAEEAQRIYLYGYASTRNRATALEGARRILMSAARTVDLVPDGCPLSVWCFFLLEEDREKPADQENLWRVLVLASNEPRGQGDEASAGSGSRPRLAEHPGVRTFVELFERYRSLPEDAEVLTRSGWSVAREDLRCFLDAQFGEAPCEDRGTGPGWRRFLPSGAWRSSRIVASVIILAVVVLLIILLRSWEGLQERPDARSVNRDGRPDQERAFVATPPSEPSPQLPPAGSAPPEIAGSADQQGAQVVFRWLAANKAESYRLFVLTARLDTLTMIGGLTRTTHELDLRSAPGLHSPGSYLFRVDGMSSDRIVASTGFIPFDLH